MSERDEILAALSGGPGLARLGPKGLRQLYRFSPHANLWNEFERNLTQLGGRLIDQGEVDELSKKRKWVDKAAEPLAKVTTDVQKIWEAEVGFAVAKCAIAQTGTLVFEAGPDSHRLSTLVPPISVVFVAEAAIIPTLTEALSFVATSDRTCVFATGPSRTADIEGVLVRGIHGPGQLLVCVF